MDESAEEIPVLFVGIDFGCCSGVVRALAWGSERSCRLCYVSFRSLRYVLRCEGTLYIIMNKINGILGLINTDVSFLDIVCYFLESG